MLSFEDYRDFDALGLAEAIRSGRMSALEVVEAAIARADGINPKINAITVRSFEEARERAKHKLPEGPFAGVPFMLKDLYAFEAGKPIDNGSHFWEGFIPEVTSTHLERTFASGLNVIGRTTSSEEGLAITTETVKHGPTRNPWDLGRTSGGSSGGAAAAVAAGILPMAGASDGGGSIRIPAAQCGLFGLKPTRARNSSGPLIGEGWAGLAINHVVSRSVRDSAAMLDATAGAEPGDPYACPAQKRPFLDEVGAPTGKLRIGIHTDGLSGIALDPENVAAVEEIARLLEEMGHTVELARPTLDIDAVMEAIITIICANQWDALDWGASVMNKPLTGEGLERVTWETALQGADYTAADYAKALTTIHAVGRTLGAFFESYDLLVSTTMATPPFPLGVLRPNEIGVEGLVEGGKANMPVTQFFNMAGCPAMSVPLCWSLGGLPIGIHIGAGFGREDTLFRVAAALEEARPWFHKTPPL